MKPTKDEITRDQVIDEIYRLALSGATKDRADKLLDQYTSHLYTQSELDREVVKGRIDAYRYCQDFFPDGSYQHRDLQNKITELTNQIKEGK